MDFSLKKFLKSKDVTDKGAFSSEDILKLELKIKRKEGISRAELIVNEDEYCNGYKSTVIPFLWENLEEGCDVLSCCLRLSDFGTGLYFVNIRLKGKNELLVYDKFDYKRQLLIFEKNAGSLKPQKGIIYHIFVDRFYSSGKSPVKETSVLNTNWDEGTPEFAKRPGDFLKNNTVFGGDLCGIAQKMDYIASLGTKYIYLSPVFEAFSNHKYDTGNYLEVDEGFGGEEGLKELIKAASSYGIKLILDGVFNHTGDDSLYFNKYEHYASVGAFNSQKSPYYSWYNFKSFPNEYESWWGIKTLPRVNSDNDDYINFICKENSVVKKWGSLGLGGWRLDVADELSDKFLENFRKSVKETDKDAIIIGEVWENASNKISYGQRRKYFLGEQLDSVMNYPLREAVISLFKEGNVEKFLQTVKIINYQYPDFAKLHLMNPLSTHDTERLITVLGVKSLDNNDNELLSKTFLTREEFKEGFERLKKAYALLYFMPGLPSVFYGDEIGMEGYHDPFCRRPFKWKAVDKSPVLPFFKKLGKIRLCMDVFADGDLKIVFENENSFVLSRENQKEKIIFAFNKSQNPLKAKADVPFKNLLTNKKISGARIKTGDILLASLPKNSLLKISFEAGSTNEK